MMVVVVVVVVVVFVINRGEQWWPLLCGSVSVGLYLYCVPIVIPNGSNLLELLLDQLNLSLKAQ